ncbi:MAG: hypothetical protein M3177_09360, partial [Pseudomonadota bacterium]|nr:hypothetical protein [Pseudomonadota bacterium]
MRRLAAWLLCFAALAPAPLSAQAIVTSAAPEQVSVTIYRDPDRLPDRPLDLNWLDGFALISETRQVVLPEGESQIRFEGVASGILPQSAIVSGLPEGIVERNRDAYLLSPGTLLERSLGRRVHLRRTSLETGEVSEQEALIRSSSDGAVVLQTAAGFEALRCTGLRETLVYDEVPAGLSPRPTLSVRVRSRQSLTATVTLSYLASNFDWQANYIATLSDDGQHVDLRAWLTLASQDDTSFVAARTQAVAGELNREEARVAPAEAPSLTLRCWPQARTHQIALELPPEPGERRGEPMLQATSPVTVVNSQEVRLTGTTRSADLIAEQEDLGDVKLYRIPEPVTVAANSQKQVAFLQRDDVHVRTVYRQVIEPDVVGDAQPAWRLLVTRNRSAEGLG